MKREILAIALFLTSLLPFNDFLPLASILLGFISLEKEWKILPAVSILTSTASYFLNYTRENALLLTLSLPIILISARYNKLVASIFFSLSVAFLPFGAQDYIILFLTAILLIGVNYRGTIISGILLLIISAFGYPYSNLAYFYLVFGVVSTILQEKITIKREHYLSLGAVLFPLLHHYAIPSILLSLGFGIFYPFSILFSAIMFYTEGVKYGLFLIPTIILPYVLKKWRNLIALSLVSTGTSWFSAIFPPLLLFLFPIYRIEKRSLIISSVSLLILSVYLIFSGIYNILQYSIISSIIPSTVLISSRFIDNLKIKISIRSLILLSIIGIVAISSILSIGFYNYTFTYIALLTSTIYFTYVSYQRKYLQFSLLAALSLITKYPLIPLSGYKLKDEANIAVIILTLTIAISHISLNYSLATLSTSLAYLMQNFKIPKIFSYIPPITIIFTPHLTGILLSILVVSSGYLIGRKAHFIGLIYEISLATSLLYITNLI